jgi:hypothetical protein
MGVDTPSMSTDAIVCTKEEILRRLQRETTCRCP